MFPMLRSTLLWLSERQSVFTFVKSNGLARTFASRFVAGESLDDAVAATRELNAKDIPVSLDLLGESVSNRDEAAAARDEAIAIVRRIRAERLQANVSIKLTQMGMDIDEALAVANTRAILGAAEGMFIRLDMEGSGYVERTLRLFYDQFQPAYGEAVGVVIQTMLRRSAADIEELIRRNARVRLVKGAYKESAAIAFPDKRDVDTQYAAQAERLLADGNYAAIATHDERLIGHVIAYARAHGIGADRFEFQMLYGVRRDLQEQLRGEGWKMRVYVPFGTEWYPYLMRRLAERPANIAFIVGNVVKERVRRP